MQNKLTKYEEITIKEYYIRQVKNMLNIDFNLSDISNIVKTKDIVRGYIDFDYLLQTLFLSLTINVSDVTDLIYVNTQNIRVFFDKKPLVDLIKNIFKFEHKNGEIYNIFQLLEKQDIHLSYAMSIKDLLHNIPSIFNHFTGDYHKFEYVKSSQQDITIPMLTSRLAIPIISKMNKYKNYEMRFRHKPFEYFVWTSEQLVDLSITVNGRHSLLKQEQTFYYKDYKVHDSNVQRKMQNLITYLNNQLSIIKHHISVFDLVISKDELIKIMKK